MPLPKAVGSLRDLFNKGALSPTELVTDIYRDLSKVPQGPVWITQVAEEEALHRAKQLQASSERPSLWGIPFAVKDNIDVAGMPTTAGCEAFRYVPEQNAFVVGRLLAAGAILIGKTNMDQFATGLVGTRSPYGACSSVFDADYISGGSSSGSAVAVASGQVSFSLGTDTAGSGRVPAAFNNLIGLKPSRGLLSTSGVVPACRSLDCVSIFALNAADANTVFEVAAAFDDGDIFSRAAMRQGIFSSPLRYGVPKAGQWEFFGNTEYERLYREAIDSVGSANIVEIDLQAFLDAAKLLYEGPYVAERFAAVGEFVKQNSAAVNDVVGAIILNSERHSASSAYKALYELESLKRKTRETWEKIDLLLLPTAPTTYTIEAVKNDPIQLNSRLGYYTNFVNLLDLSAVAIPAGFTNAGLPFGISLIAPAFHEQALLRVASVFAEDELPAISHSGWVPLAVLGAHLRGQPLNWQLTDRGARFVRQTKTAADYKLYALESSVPPKPGLVRIPGFKGPGIDAEIWLVPDDQFGSFVQAIPPPLGIGTCQLMDGSFVKGFLCESWAAEGSLEITGLGGWRAYLHSK